MNINIKRVVKEMSSKEGLVLAFEALKNALIDCRVNELDNIISKDYKGFSLNGTVEKKQDIIRNFKPGGVKLSRYDVVDIEYEFFNEIGIITGKGTIVGSYQEFEFEHNVLFTDIFKFENNSWKYYRSQVTEIPSS